MRHGWLRATLNTKSFNYVNIPVKGTVTTVLAPEVGKLRY